MANVLKAGDTAVVEFNRFYHPANKLSGIYNMGAYVTMTGEDGTAYKTSGGQYTFASYKQGQQNARNHSGRLDRQFLCPYYG